MSSAWDSPGIAGYAETTEPGPLISLPRDLGFLAARSTAGIQPPRSVSKKPAVPFGAACVLQFRGNHHDSVTKWRDRLLQIPRGEAFSPDCLHSDSKLFP